MPKVTRISGPAKPGSFLILAAFLSFLVFGLSGTAHAASAPTDPCLGSAAGSVNANFQQIFAKTGYTRTNAATQILGMFGAIDVKAQYCWSQIQSLFETIANLQDASFNPFKTIITAIVNEIGSQILALISSACSAALNTIGSFKSFLLSQLNHMCIPIPNLQLGLGSVAGFSFANSGTCAGPGSVPVFSFGYATPVMTPSNTLYRNFLPAAP